MKEKVKQTMGRLRKSVRAAGVGLSTLAASFFMSAPAYAAGVEDSQIVTGTEQLIGDLTNWLMILAPVVSGLLIIYFCIRRGSSMPDGGADDGEEPEGVTDHGSKFGYYDGIYHEPAGIRVICKGNDGQIK